MDIDIREQIKIEAYKSLVILGGDKGQQVVTILSKLEKSISDSDILSELQIWNKENDKRTIAS